MTPQAFCRSGTAEKLKAATHAGMLVLASTCLAYNATAWCFRRERHLAGNAVVYGALVWLEVQHVRHHLQRPDATGGAVGHVTAP